MDISTIIYLNHYQKSALRTNNTDRDQAEHLTYLALGLNGEAGEVAEHIKKHVFHGHSLSLDDMKKELGDVLWYVAVLAEHLGFSLQFVANENIAKLQARYPDGFSQARSINRGDDD